MDATGREFVDFWEWAGKKGLINMETAKSLGGTARRMLEVIDDWETTDVRTLDIDTVITRFKNLRHRDFKPGSLRTYEGRLRKAHQSYLRYLDNPSTWKHEPASIIRSSATKAKTPKSKNNSKPVQSPTHPRDDNPQTNSVASTEVGDAFVNTILLRDGRQVRLSTPRDLRETEVDKLLARIGLLLRAVALEDIENGEQAE